MNISNLVKDEIILLKVKSHALSWLQPQIISKGLSFTPTVHSIIILLLLSANSGVPSHVQGIGATL